MNFVFRESSNFWLVSWSQSMFKSHISSSIEYSKQLFYYSFLILERLLTISIFAHSDQINWINKLYNNYTYITECKNPNRYWNKKFQEKHFFSFIADDDVNDCEWIDKNSLVFIRNIILRIDCIHFLTNQIALREKNALSKYLH